MFDPDATHLQSETNEFPESLSVEGFALLEGGLQDELVLPSPSEEETDSDDESSSSEEETDSDDESSSSEEETDHPTKRARKHGPYEETASETVRKVVGSGLFSRGNSPVGETRLPCKQSIDPPPNACAELDKALIDVMNELSRLHAVDPTFVSFEQCREASRELSEFFDDLQTEDLDDLRTEGETAPAKSRPRAEDRELTECIGATMRSNGAIAEVSKTTMRALDLIGLTDLYRANVDTLACKKDKDEDEDEDEDEDNSARTRRIDGISGKANGYQIVICLHPDNFMSGKLLISTLAHEMTHVLQLARCGQQRTVQDQCAYEFFGYQTELLLDCFDVEEQREDAEKNRDDYFLKLKPSRRRALREGGTVSPTDPQSLSKEMCGALAKLEGQLDNLSKEASNAADMCFGERRRVVKRALTYVRALIARESATDAPITPWTKDHLPPGRDALQQQPVPK